MLPNIQPFLERLDINRRRFLDQLNRQSEAQRTFRATPEVWCPLQVAQHVILAEMGATKVMCDPKLHPVQRRGLKDRILWAAVNVVLSLHLKAKAPKASIPKGDWDLEEIESRWEKVRLQLRAYLEGLDEEAAKRKVFKHPYGGPLDVEMTLDFMDKHLEHHLKQLERIQSAETWPTA